MKLQMIVQSTEQRSWTAKSGEKIEVNSLALTDADFTLGQMVQMDVDKRCTPKPGARVEVTVRSIQSWKDQIRFRGDCVEVGK